jgi:hypothetical protein
MAETVTAPIWADPAASAGSELTVTVVLVRVTACAGTDARLTGWVACQNVPLTGTVPVMEAVTDPIWAVPAERAGRELTVTVVLVSVTA